MKINSLYPSMVHGAGMIPFGQNVKLIIRHSFRDSLRDKDDPDKVPLNSKGIECAELFGKGLEYNIGGLFSSRIVRCQQTIESICKGKGIQKAIAVDGQWLTDVHITDEIQIQKTFLNIGSMKKALSILSNGEIVSGFTSIEVATNRILDYIFSRGNTDNTVDVFCTHDVIIMMVIVHLFLGPASHEVIRSNWPEMLEGLFFWGNRDDFTVIWRGEMKRFLTFG